jgi:hypothetical protein
MTTLWLSNECELKSFVKSDSHHYWTYNYYVRLGFNKSIERYSIVDDIQFVFSSRPIIVILAVSTLFRIVFHFFVLPNSPSGLGPDEGTYGALAKYVSQGLPVEEFPDYGAGLYNSAKSITLPSAFLVQLGMGELSAVRTIASIYGLASSLVLVLCFLAVLRLRSQPINRLSAISDRKFLALLLIFTFFPSNFVWSTIGLRESGSQFWLITTFYLILKLLGSAGRGLWKFTGLCSLALTMAYGTRPETALVFSLIALLTSIVLLLKFRNFFPLIAILLGVYTGQLFTTTPKVLAVESYGAYQIVEQELTRSATPKPEESNQSATPKPEESNQSATPKPEESNQSATPKPEESIAGKENESASSECTQENQIIQFEGKKFQCKTSKTYQVKERNPANTLEEQILTPQILEYKRSVNALYAQSNLPASTCQNSSRDIFILIECNFKELPYRLFAFLFRPLLFFDQGSAFLNFAAIENLGWMILVPLSMWVSIRRRENTLVRIINLSLTSYVLLFASSAALYEGNLGTAFRHKSSILWPLVFILMIAPRILPKSRRETKTLS